MEVLIPVLVGVVALVILLDLLYGPKQEKAPPEPSFSEDTISIYLSNSYGERVATTRVRARWVLRDKTFWLEDVPVWFDVLTKSDITHWGIVGWDVDCTVDTPLYSHKGPVKLNNVHGEATNISCKDC